MEVSVLCSEELDGAEEGAVATDREEVVDVFDAVAVMDNDGLDGDFLQGVAKLLDGWLVCGFDLSIVEGDFHCCYILFN